VEGDRGAGEWEKRGREVYGRCMGGERRRGRKWEKNYALGNFFKFSYPRGRGRALVQGKSIKCVSEWLEKNNLSLA